MHFDEVYHARTATEFLQDWRYGISHDIYEWTHPHLAKYLMAAGIVAWGEDHVSATSDLGVTVRAAAVEPRRDAGPVATDASPAGSATVPEVRAGERLHIATGSEIRTYDLRTRALISVVAAPGAGALAIDETGNQLVIGYDDGRLATLDLDLIGAGGVATGLPAGRPRHRGPPRDASVRGGERRAGDGRLRGSADDRRSRPGQRDRFARPAGDRGHGVGRQRERAGRHGRRGDRTVGRRVEHRGHPEHERRRRDRGQTRGRRLGLARDDGRPRFAGEWRRPDRPRQGDRRREAARDQRRQRRSGRRRGRRRGRLRRPGAPASSSRRSSWPAERTAWRW